MCGRKSYALVSVEKRVVIQQRLHKSRSFLRHTVVIAYLRAENGGFQQTTVSKTIASTVMIDLLFVNGENFRDGQVEALGHLLLRELLIKLSELLIRAPIRLQHLWSHQALGKDHVVKVMFDGLLQEKSLGLPVFLSNRNELLVQLRVDGRTNLNRLPRLVGTLGHFAGIPEEEFRKTVS